MDSNSNLENIKIRQMERNDFKQSLDCFSSHGHNESLSNLRVFYECDPKGFYVAINEDNSKTFQFNIC